MMNKDKACIILAAGQGSRFGAKKQFIIFKDKEIWKHVYDKIAKYIPKENIVVVGVDVEGGITRSQSVIKGLIELKKRGSFKRVIILEAARPLVTFSQLETILKDDHLSTTYVLPVINTIVSKKGDYLNRSDYYCTSTPVAFDFNYFYEAYMSNKYFDFTDDTWVMYEHYGIKPHFIEGAENLIKITYPSDLHVVEMLYDRYEKQ